MKINIFRTDDLRIFYYILYFFQGAIVDDQKSDAGLIHDLGQGISRNPELIAKRMELLTPRQKRQRKIRGYYPYRRRKKVSVFVQPSAVNQFLPYMQEEICVALGLLINFPIRIFTAFKYEKHSITPEPKPP